MQSMPFALRRGGWLALAALVLITPLFALSGQLMVWAFDLMPAGAPRTYPQLGAAAGGRAGKRAVLLFSFLELWGGGGAGGRGPAQHAAPLRVLAALATLDGVSVQLPTGRARPAPAAA